MTTPQVTLRGEAGSEWTFDLPLTDAIRAQVESAYLHPVDAESAELLGDLWPEDRR